MNKNILKKINKIQVDIGNAFKPLHSINQTFNPIFESINKIRQPIIKLQKISMDLNTNFSHFSEVFKRVVIMLGEEGWFIDEEMPISYIRKFENISKIKNNSFYKIQNDLVKYYTLNLDEIENSIIKSFPNREKIICSAFQAHKDKKYELSIPVLLTQIDGICFEKTDKYYFMKKRGTQYPETFDYVEEVIQDEFNKILYTGLTKSFPINHSKNQRKLYNKPNSLNRHQIIHGESIEYPSKINSLKVISLINYINQILEKEE